MDAERTIWTIGHSNLSFDEFHSMLEIGDIEYLIDVRSSPYSKYVAHFDRESISQSLERHAIKYLFMGDSLGGRPSADSHIDDDGHALYEPMSRESEFKESVQRLLVGSENHRIAIMCSCGSPESCHRRRLVGKVLCDLGVELRHIRKDHTVWVEREVNLDPDRQLSILQSHPVWRSTNPIGGRRRQAITA